MDNIIIQKVIEGDTSSFSYFLDNYKDTAFLIAYRIIGIREDAEEVVQDSFLKAFKSLNSFKFESKFSTWFYKIVVNTSLSRIRKKDQPQYVDIENYDDVIVGTVNEVYKNLVRDEQKKYVNKALTKLSEDDRILLVLYYINDNTFSEIQEITGIAVPNIKMKIHRARKKMFLVLKEELNNVEIINLI